LVSVATVTGEVAFVADWVAPPSLEVHVTVKPLTCRRRRRSAVTATSTAFEPGVMLPNVGRVGHGRDDEARRRRGRRAVPARMVASAGAGVGVPFVRVATVTGEVALVADWGRGRRRSTCSDGESGEGETAGAVRVSATMAGVVTAVTLAMEVRRESCRPRTGSTRRDAPLSPIELVATTVQVYVRPFDSEATSNGEPQSRFGARRTAGRRGAGRLVEHDGIAAVGRWVECQ